ncbi:hypothetical protein MicloDRAFT_00070240 [Microvirga lotononidis]|uniref:Uncharacterized protein n=1 Tax=Microvirga lotononidis TaxID=864069 RepID=I4YK79_9HYPH|nr:hypothetical protein MicloDRAFT_00070240 [Microvirga lotononidis]
MGITTERAIAPVKFASVPSCRPDASAISLRGVNSVGFALGNPNCGEGQVLHMKVPLASSTPTRKSWGGVGRLSRSPGREIGTAPLGADRISEAHAADR